MVSSSYQTALRIFKTNIIEIQYFALFICTTLVNKFVLSELHFKEPTVFQGWQTFTCVLLLSALVQYGKGISEVKMLDRRTFLLLLPGFICFAVYIVAGSKGLAELPVPVFCAILSLNPAIMVLVDKKIDFSDNLKRVCGSTVICGTVVVILVMTINKQNAESYLWLIGHVVLGILYTLYMGWINAETSNTSKIYYRNCFSVIILLPLSIYLDVLYVPYGVSWEFYLGCILSGVLGTFLQMITLNIEQKSSFMNCQGRARLVCSLIAHKLFFANVEPIIWVLIIINMSINSTVLSPSVETAFGYKKSKLTFFVGPPPSGRELDIDKAIPV